MHNLLYAISIELDLEERSVKKNSTHSTLQFKGKDERLLLCFCLHICLTLILYNGRTENTPYL